MDLEYLPHQITENLANSLTSDLDAYYEELAEQFMNPQDEIDMVISRTTRGGKHKVVFLLHSYKNGKYYTVSSKYMSPGDIFKMTRRYSCESGNYIVNKIIFIRGKYAGKIYNRAYTPKSVQLPLHRTGKARP